MQQKQISYLSRVSQVLFILISATAIVYITKPVLVPIAFAAVLAMLFIPLSRKMENAGVNRAVATLCCIILFVLACALIVGLLAWQLSSVMNDLEEIKQRFSSLVRQLQSFIRVQTGLSRTEQQEVVKEAGKGSTDGMLGQITSALLGALINVILVLVYIFLLMFFRTHLMQFVKKAVPVTQRGNVADLLHEAGNVSQKYLGGLATMIITLWIMYSIGFSIVGVKYAIFFAVLCGTLEIVPFIGNITGTLLTGAMGLLQGGDLKLIVGIFITYGLVQFIQTYLLEPLVVGKGVNLNPLFTIMSIVIGDAVWGIPGMVLAVPIFGMIKIFCDHFETLKPYGFLLGCDEKDASRSGILERIKKIF